MRFFVTLVGVQLMIASCSMSHSVEEPLQIDSLIADTIEVHYPQEMHPKKKNCQQNLDRVDARLDSIKLLIKEHRKHLRKLKRRR